MRRVRKVWIPGMLDARERRMNRFAPGFDPQPRLASDLVALRPLTAADFEALFAVASDPEIWALHPAHNRWQELVFRRFFDDALASGGALVAVDPATGAVIGSSRYDTGRADPGEVEIGWTFLARRYWGGAVNGAMKSLMIAHALAAGAGEDRRGPDRPGAAGRDGGGDRHARDLRDGAGSVRALVSLALSGRGLGVARRTRFRGLT
jgi:hypothetical protein